MERSEDILSADKLLFATDLVDHVILKTRPNFVTKTVSIMARADRVRNFTYNRFNTTIKKALKIIDVNQDNSVYSDFETMMNENRVNKESFVEYANNYRTRHLPGGFHAKSFLMYCDRVANMAGYFLSFGVDDAAEVAVELIMQAFPESVMYHGTWNKLTKVSEQLEVLGNDYFGDNMSSDSCSESEELISSGNEDSTSSSVNMDMSVSSPEDVSRRNLDMASSILEKTSKIMNAGNVSIETNLVYKSLLEMGEALNSQSSDSASSSTLSSFKCSSTENPTSPEETNISKSDS